MLPIINVGPLAIQAPLLFVFLGFWVAVQLSEREARRLNLYPDHVSGVLSAALFGGIVSGRLVYVIRFLEAFRDDWWGFISLNPSTIDRIGGILGGLIIMLGYFAVRRLPWRVTFDALTPSLGVLTTSLAASLLASGGYYGSISQLPWAIFLWGAPRHPTQLYLLVGALGVTGAVWWLARRVRWPGGAFLIWLGGTAAVLFVVEGFRGSSPLTDGGLRWWQPVFLAVVLIAMTMFYRLTRFPWRSY